MSDRVPCARRISLRHNCGNIFCYRLLASRHQLDTNRSASLPKLPARENTNRSRQAMTTVAKVQCRYATAELPARSINAGITAFLDGRTDGGELLHALYDHVLDEPIPHSMRNMIQEPAPAGISAGHDELIVRGLERQALCHRTAAVAGQSRFCPSAQRGLRGCALRIGDRPEVISDAAACRRGRARRTNAHGNAALLDGLQHRCWRGFDSRCRPPPRRGR